MRLSIFGMGYVGAVSGACLADLGHQVIGVDTNAQKVEAINAGASPIVEAGVDERMAAALEAGRLSATLDAEQAVLESDASMISVGTPSGANGQVSLDAVGSVVEDIGRAIRKKQSAHAVIVRSTIPPGTTEGRLGPLLVEAAGRDLGAQLSLSVNPEFLREGSAVKDFHHPPFTVAGSMSDRGLDVVAEIYQAIEAPLLRTDCSLAESIKYLSNVFHAVKITFANEFGALLKAVGVDSRDALELFCQDRDLNISAAYLRPGFAFGGSCLPKEVRAIVGLARSLEIDLPMISHVLDSNQSHVDRAFALITEGGRKRVALFGLAFKPGTDDLRESPFVSLAERLIGRGFELRIFDHCLELGRLIGSNRDFIEREIPHLERLLAATPAAALESAEVAVIGHLDSSGRQALLEHAPRPLTVVDLQGIDELRAVEGITYRGICW